MKDKMKKIIMFGISVLIGTFFLVPVLALGQESDVVLDSQQISQEVEGSTVADVFLQAQTERENLIDFVELMVVIISVVVAAVTFAIAIFSFIGFRNIKNTIGLAVEDKIINEVKLKLNIFDTRLKKETGYSESRLVLVGSNTVRQPIEENIISRVDVNEFKNYDTYEKITDPAMLRQNDMVVFCLNYNVDPSKESTEQLGDLVDILIKKELQIPLIIMTSPPRVDGDTLKKLNKYKWYLMANTPGTLVNNIYTTSSVFYKIRKDV